MGEMAPKLQQPIQSCKVEQSSSPLSYKNDLLGCARAGPGGTCPRCASRRATETTHGVQLVEPLRHARCETPRCDLTLIDRHSCGLDRLSGWLHVIGMQIAWLRPPPSRTHCHIISIINLSHTHSRSHSLSLTVAHPISADCCARLQCRLRCCSTWPTRSNRPGCRTAGIFTSTPMTAGTTRTAAWASRPARCTQCGNFDIIGGPFLTDFRRATPPHTRSAACSAAGCDADRCLQSDGVANSCRPRRSRTRPTGSRRSPTASTQKVRCRAK